jgi:hypothetical protein
MISTLQDILNFFPPGSIQDVGGGEYHSPCPFCESKTGETHEYAGHLFVGDDRFVWFSSHTGCYCRRENRYYGYKDVVERLSPGNVISDDLKVEVTVERQKRAVVLADESFVDELHSHCDRSFWYRFNWSDDVIDHFRLGFGPLYRASANESRHVIPFVPHTVSESLEGYSFEGRRTKKKRDGKDNIKTAGLTGRDYFWYIQERPEDRRLAITEGLKDAITAWICGYENFMAIFGTSAWNDEFMQFVVDQGYTELILFGDNDEPGQELNKKIKEAAQNYDLSVHYFQHPTSAPQGYDLTDFLVEQGSAAVVERILPMAYIPSTGFLHDYRMVDKDYQPVDPGQGVHYTKVRSELMDVLHNYLDNYQDDRKQNGPSVKVIAAPPGTGKSYAMIKAAEEEAVKHQREFVMEQHRLLQSISEWEDQLKETDDEDERDEIEGWIDKARTRFTNMGQQHILFAGPFVSGWDDIKENGANTNLWYNYEARNKANCETLRQPNPELNINELASRGYSIMGYCQKKCPYNSACKVSGYLSQEEIRRQKPITYARHQNLGTSLVEDYKVIFVDENPITVFDQPMVATIEDFRPLSQIWTDYVDVDQVNLLTRLIRAILYVIAANDPYRELSGYDFFKALDVELSGEVSDIVYKLSDDTIEAFQPDNLLGVGDYDLIPKRVVPLLLRMMKSEITHYDSGQQLYNTRIHLVGRELEVYPIEILDLPKNRPIVVADGTALPGMYAMLFNRRVSLYAPKIYSPFAHTTVLHGSDFTRTSIKKQTGVAIDDYFKYLKEQRATIEDVFGEEFNLEQIQVDENMYNSSLLKKAVDLLKGVSEKHKKTLFVTHRPIRLLLEHRFREMYPELSSKISFGHYGSLRGTNRFKDHEAVLLIGCPRVSYKDLRRRIMAWAWLDESIPYVPPNIIVKVAPYHSRYEGHSYLSLDNDFADKFIRMVEEGEVQQCIDRIRLFSSDEDKFAYIAMSRPGAMWVTEIDSSGALADMLGDGKRSQIATYVLEYHQVYNKYPTYKLMSKKFNVSFSTVKEVLDKIKKEKEAA